MGLRKEAAENGKERESENDVAQPVRTDHQYAGTIRQRVTSPGIVDGTKIYPKKESIATKRDDGRISPPQCMCPV